MNKNPEIGEETAKMNRAEFLFAVGSATAGIAGWVLFPGSSSAHSEIETTDVASNPRLAPDVSFRRTEDGGELVQLDERRAPVVVGHLNEYGSKVVEGMTGQHTAQDLARLIHEGVDPAILEKTEASVALFLVTLAQAGLLAEPFFVNLHAAEIVG